MIRPATSIEVSEQHSAGGLVVRGDEVLLIATAGGRRWQLPKGHLEAGELPAEAAVREVREEAITRLSHANDRRVAEQAWRIVREGQVELPTSGAPK